MHRHLHNGNLKLSSVEEGQGGKGRVCEGKREAKGSGERRVHGTTSRVREKGAENAFNRFFKAQGRKPQMPLPPTLHQHTHLFRQPQQLYVEAPALQPLVAKQRHRCPPTEELRGVTGALKGGEGKRQCK